MSLKTVKKKGIHDYESRTKWVKRQIESELSKANVELITQYEMEMVRQSISIATRQKHLRTLLGLSRILQKDWKEITKNDVEKLVYEIMQKHADESGKETNYSYDHKKVLKIFVRWMKLGSREFREVGDPPETIKVRMKKVKDKIIREDLLTDDDISRLLHVCGENARDRALIDCHYEGGTRPGEILTILIKHVKFDQYGANLHVDGKTGPRTVRLVKSTPTLANWLSIHPFKDKPESPVWINLAKNHYGEQLAYPAASAMFRRRAKMAHLNKRVNLNLFRHSEATNAAKFMTESQLRKRHGWTADSKMPGRYVHLVNADVDAAIFEHLGIKTQEKEEKNMPKICHVCEMPNSSDYTICSKCGKPLDLKTALAKEEKEKEEKESVQKQLATIQVELDKVKQWRDISQKFEHLKN
jgi:integrase/recombinase XerD